MEALTLTIDCIAMVLLVYMGMRDETRRLDASATSLFRSIDDERAAPPAAAKPPRTYAR